MSEKFLDEINVEWQQVYDVFCALVDNFRDSDPEHEMCIDYVKRHCNIERLEIEEEGEWVRIKTSNLPSSEWWIEDHALWIAWNYCILEQSLMVAGSEKWLRAKELGETYEIPCPIEVLGNPVDALAQQFYAMHRTDFENHGYPPEAHPVMGVNTIITRLLGVQI